MIVFLWYTVRMETKKTKQVHIGKESLFTRNKGQKPFVLDVLFLTLKLLLVAVLIVGMAGAGLVYGVFKAYIDTTPVFDTAQLTKSDRTSHLYDVNGNELMSLSAIEYRETRLFPSRTSVSISTAVSISKGCFPQRWRSSETAILPAAARSRSS